MLDRPAERDGYVLIEALVALAIISLIVVMSLNSLVESIHRLRRAEERLVALAEARSVVTRISSAEYLSPGILEGASPSGNKWTLVVEREKSSAEAGKVRLFRISAAVKSKGENEPLIVLRTSAIAGLRPE